MIAIDVRHVTVAIAGRRILEDVSFHVQPGEIVLLTGHNGSGKSTCLRAIAGELKVASGDISITSDIDEDLTPALVGQQDNLFLDKTILENLSAERFGRFRAPMAERQELGAEIASIFPPLGDRAGSPCRQLSGGMRQMAATARGLITPRRLVLLDEPTVGLTSRLAESVLASIQSHSKHKGKTVVIAEHRIAETARICDRIGILRDGRLVYFGDSSIVNDQVQFDSLYRG